MHQQEAFNAFGNVQFNNNNARVGENEKAGYHNYLNLLD